jgi:hypothetical protein
MSAAARNSILNKIRARDRKSAAGAQGFSEKRFGHGNSKYAVSISLYDDRDEPIVNANFARYHAYAHAHNYSVFLDGGDYVYDANRSEVPKDLLGPENIDLGRLGGTGVKHLAWSKKMSEAFGDGITSAVPWGLMTAWDCWPKISNALRIMATAEENSWLWLADTDVIVMDLAQSLDPLISEAEREGQSLIRTSWAGCGDGVNAGSIMVKNNEDGRAFLHRMQDSRILWQTFFVSDQGALWILGAHCHDDERCGYDTPARTLNARPAAIGCAENQEVKENVYFHPGDFAQHFAGWDEEAGMPPECPRVGERKVAGLEYWESIDSLSPECRSSLGKGPNKGEILRDTLKSLESFPCKDFCDREQIQRPPAGEDRPETPRMSPLSISTMCVGSPKDPKVYGRCKELERFGSTHNATKITSQIHEFFDMTGIPFIPTEEHLPVWAKNEGGSAFGGAFYRGDDCNQCILFPSAGGWGGLVSAWHALKDMRGKTTSNHWLVVDSGATKGLTITRLYEKIQTAPREARLIASEGCHGPWAILSSEWGRTLLLRLRDSWLTRRNRILIKLGQGMREPGEEDRGGFAEAMCMAMRRDPLIRRYTQKI